AMIVRLAFLTVAQANFARRAPSRTSAKVRGPSLRKASSHLLELFSFLRGMGVSSLSWNGSDWRIAKADALRLVACGSLSVFTPAFAIEDERARALRTGAHQAAARFSDRVAAAAAMPVRISPRWLAAEDGTRPHCVFLLSSELRNASCARSTRI